MFEIKGKFALVTGGAEGIGLCYSNALLKNGAAGLIIADIQEEKGAQLVASLNKQYGANKVVFAKTDVTNPDQLENAYKIAISKFGWLDIVINNAGILRDKTWELEININCNAVVKSTLLAMKYLGKTSGGRGGVVVNISSIAGLDAIDICPIYVGTKHFVQGFTRSFSSSFYYNLTGIEFRIICPGVTDTALMSDGSKFVMDGFPGLGKLFSDAVKTLPIQKPEFVAEALIKVVIFGKNGSIWSPEGNKLYRVEIPDRISMRTEESL